MRIKLLYALLAVSMLTLPEAYAETDAELLASGQWRDPDTDLIWMRCSIGQEWTGTTCIGEPLELNWQDAKDYFSLSIFSVEGFAGHTDWRLPSIEELSGIRRCSTGWMHRAKYTTKQTSEGSVSVKESLGVWMTEVITEENTKDMPWWCNDGSVTPSLNTVIFPNSPKSAGHYWSSSSHPKLNGSGWYVRFHCGYLSHNNTDAGMHVRAVRTSR